MQETVVVLHFTMKLVYIRLVIVSFGMLTTYNSSSSCNSNLPMMFFLKPIIVECRSDDNGEKKSEELNWYAAWMAVGICILSCNYKFVMLKNRML
jgi:hypothetical protein